MDVRTIFNPKELGQRAKDLFAEERDKKRLDGWFLIRETVLRARSEFAAEPPEIRAALSMRQTLLHLPLAISPHAIFAGTQNDAFARSYALINPSFAVESFAGYCDPTAVFNDIEPNDEFTPERIEGVQALAKDTDYVRELTRVYDQALDYTGEVAFFIEQVTGHLIPDFRPALKFGLSKLASEIGIRLTRETDAEKRVSLTAMQLMLENAVLLAGRYASLAGKLGKTAVGQQKELLALMEKTLRKVPAQGADTLYEAMQSFLILWQVMCVEQAPNPFAFSVGNADRIFCPYMLQGGDTRETAAGLFRHFLVFFNVADRSWAISQNLILGGKSGNGRDLSNEMTYAILDAYYDMNLPQPILSVKLHAHTPDALYRALGKFFFTPGCLTPSLFNDDSVFEVLRASGIEESDLEDYSIAGCQEMLIMGKDNGNTTNSWLNLAKILELTLHGGVSALTGKQILPLEKSEPLDILENLRERFYENLALCLARMTDAANGASRAIALEPVPFLSAFMGGLDSGVDLRNASRQGTKYNGSGCLIHGLSVVSDSFVAIDSLLRERPGDAQRLMDALASNFERDLELRDYLLSCPKYGNNTPAADDEAVLLASRVSDMVQACKNYLGNPFRADWSTPSTHLLYGYWVGATPDGRKSREMLGYGIDPLHGEATNGMGFRMLSAMKLPFGKMNGGYASHLGIDPQYFSEAVSHEDKGMAFRQKVIAPLFFNALNPNLAPFYLYVNVTTPAILRQVLEKPKEYAPSGVYIMRIHGTFVNFLDLSPAIQQDIILRLDPASTTLA